MAQKRAVRTISNAQYDAHTEPLFFANKILKVHDMYKHYIASYVYANSNLIIAHRTHHSYDTRNNDQLLAPRVRLRTTEQSIAYNAVLIWNDVPDEIKTCPSIVSFKFNYKNYLLNQYNSSRS